MLRRAAAIAVVSMIAVVAAVILLYRTATHHPRPGPILGPYEVQTVTNRVSGSAGPALRYGETAVIEGTLCNRTASPVPVLTTLSWQAVGHTGTFVTIATDIAQTRKPGCESFVGANAFHNPMPATVVAAAKSLGPSVKWVINGFEVPVAANGTHGKALSFTSEPFVILP